MRERHVGRRLWRRRKKRSSSDPVDGEHDDGATGVAAVGVRNNNGDISDSGDGDALG